MNKINKITSFAFLFLSGVVLFSAPPEKVNAASNTKLDVFLDGKQMVFDQEPIVINGVTYIPLRNVAETTGSNVVWDGETKLITISDDSKKLVFGIGEEKGILNENTITMPKSFVVKETYRTMVPLRFVSENLGLDVEWVQETSKVLITAPNNNLKSNDLIVVEDKGSLDKTQEDLIRIANELQENAKKYIGTPYLYGASPNTVQYFDCSSFTQRLFAESGINLPRVSSAQYKYGKDIKFSELKTGDLVFFDTAGNGTITHVSIFINQNSLLHATVSKGVDYTTFGTYWKDRFVSAARVIN